MPSVKITPGATQLTRIRNGAHSTATVFDRAMIPARAAAVWAAPRMPRSTTTTTLTIDWPGGDATVRMTGPAAKTFDGEWHVTPERGAPR